VVEIFHLFFSLHESVSL